MAAPNKPSSSQQKPTNPGKSTGMPQKPMQGKPSGPAKPGQPKGR